MNNFYPYQVTASIVLYNPGEEVFKAIDSFLKITSLKIFLYLIDNSPADDFETQNQSLLSNNKIKYFFTGKNLGYGAAHNIALRQAMQQSEYHLVLNPDVYFDEGVVEKIYEYAIANKDIAHIMPRILYPDKTIQYNCKLIPAPSDLILRLFPGFFFQQKKGNFELRFTGYDKIMEVPYLSGCFMFLKTSALQTVGLFDERFFMYAEDVDMSRRMNEKFMTVYYPAVSIFHKHAKSSFKNLNMFGIHAKNMIRYFNKWGWFFDAERKRTNAGILKKLKQH